MVDIYYNLHTTLNRFSIKNEIVGRLNKHDILDGMIILFR